MFFWNSRSFFGDPVDVGNMISGSSAFYKSSLNIWKFTVHVLLKPGLENFEHYFASVWDECNCAIAWAFFDIAFLWGWNENSFSSPVVTAEFSKFAGILSAALSQHHLLGFENPPCSTHYLILSSSSSWTSPSKYIHDIVNNGPWTKIAPFLRSLQSSSIFTAILNVIGYITHITGQKPNSVW